MIKTEKQFVPLTIEPMLLKDVQLAAALNISVAHLRALDNQGKLPKAVSLGKSKRWVTSEVRAWTNAKCPDRITWMQQRSGNG